MDAITLLILLVVGFILVGAAAKATAAQITGASALSTDYPAIKFMNSKDVLESPESRQTQVRRYFSTEYAAPATPKQEQASISTKQYVYCAILGLVATIVVPANPSTAILVGTLFTLSLLFVARTRNLGSARILHDQTVARYNEYRKQLDKYNSMLPSDEQMDIWLAEDSASIIKHAKAALAVVDELVININEPLIIIGPQNNTSYKVGRDSVLRFSDYKVVVIFLSNYHLGSYSCSLDFRTGRTTSDETQEYHYVDVVSVSTQTTNSGFVVRSPDGQEAPIPIQQQFSLSVASGESIRVTVAFPVTDGIFKDNKLQPTGAEKAVNLIRAQLRHMKGGLPQSAGV